MLTANDDKHLLLNVIKQSTLLVEKASTMKSRLSSIWSSFVFAGVRLCFADEKRKIGGFSDHYHHHTPTATDISGAIMCGLEKMDFKWSVMALYVIFKRHTNHSDIFSPHTDT